MKKLKEGDRVRLKSIDRKGRVFYIDHPTLYLDHFLPIQVELDKPYEEHGQTMYRTTLRDIVRLKKKTSSNPIPKKRKKRVIKDHDIFDFTDV